MSVSSGLKTLRLVSHPLVTHLLTQARDERTQPPRFRTLLDQLGVLMAIEATRDLPTRALTVQTPLEEFEGQQLEQPVTIISILRAGLGMAQGMIHLMPDARVGHIGMFRDESELVPVQYYEKVPRDIAETTVLLVDPMLATGGSASAAIRLLRSYGCRDVRLLCLVAAPEGVERVTADDPSISIFAAALDRELNKTGFILPGLGDAGDRQFGTAEG